jgi:hypothetical protein
MSDRQEPRPDAPDPSRAPRWLLLVQQLPTRPVSVRIRVWRRLRHIGSVVLKNSVYVLPNTPDAREDFEWLCAEIRAAKGQATIMSADALTREQDEDIRDAFRAARDPEYDALARRARDVGKAAASARTRAGAALGRSVRACRDELARLDRINFCGAPARAAAAAAVETLEASIMPAARPPAGRPAAPAIDRREYRRRSWVTRPRPGVDRMASAWLIQRFIDPAARFTFAAAGADASRVPKNHVPFDMFGAEFGHQGGDCTFETLCRRFAIDEPAVRRLAAIVHNVDLKEQRFDAPEAATVESLIEGLRATYADDRALLEHGMALFAGLYATFVHDAPARARGRTTDRSKRTK